MFKEGLFVTGIDPTYTALLQTRLVAINGQPTHKVISLFNEAIQHYNPSYFDVYFLNFINNPTFLKGLGIINTDQDAEFTLMDKDGKESKVKLTSVQGSNSSNLKLTQANSGLLSQKKKGNYWFDYDPDKKAIYINYNKCREEENNPFAKFNDEV